MSFQRRYHPLDFLALNQINFTYACFSENDIDTVSAYSPVHAKRHRSGGNGLFGG
jgi:hypothetical protein